MPERWARFVAGRETVTPDTVRILACLRTAYARPAQRALHPHHCTRFFPLLPADVTWVAALASGVNVA